MKRYEIKLKPSVLKQLKAIDKKQAARILAKVSMLAEDPFPSASTPLIGTEAFRLRIGDYRVIYQVKGEDLLILVVRVGHRRDVYKA